MLDFGSIQRKFVVRSGWCQIFVEIKHFWPPRPKIIHVSELISAEYTIFLKKIAYLIIFTIVNQPFVFPLSHQKCLRNHKRIFIDANKYLPFPVMVSKIKDLLPGIILPAPGGK